MPKLDILAFGAHPDDVELGCSGTLLSHIEQGKKAGIVDLTRGELGTRGTAETRDEEAAKASEILGITFRKNLKMADGFFTNDKEHQLKIVEVIRETQPEIVLCNATTDRHPDHGRAARLVTDAAFLAGLVKVDTGQKPFRPNNIYHYMQDRLIKPDIVVDISNHFEQKMESIMAYGTQFYNPDSKEADTYISSADFLAFLKARMHEMGHLIGVKYGEGFSVQRTVGVDSLFDLK